MGKMTEEDRLMRRINQRFMKGVMNYKLIEEGDRILVGLSGGKDSLALLELLARRSRIYKPKFSVVAAHVVMKNIAYESDQTYLREYAESLFIDRNFWLFKFYRFSFNFRFSMRMSFQIKT